MKDMEAASGHHDFEIQTDLLMAIHSQRKVTTLIISVVCPFDQYAPSSGYVLAIRA